MKDSLNKKQPKSIWLFFIAENSSQIADNFVCFNKLRFYSARKVTGRKSVIISFFPINEKVR